MTASFYPGPWSDGNAFAHAEAFLAKGKSKTSRPIANNTRLTRVSEDAIAVVFHSTAVVTYHRNGLFTVYGGGWNSVTTKARIRDYSPARPHSDGDGGWIVGYTGELTPARVQKCRTCKGRGRWVEDDYCYGPGWHRKRCEGPVTSWPDGYSSPSVTTPCEHGRTEHGSHPVEPCEHGEVERHRTGESERTCYRCKGAGRVDYGSKPVPVTVNAYQAYNVDPTGTFLGLTDTPYTPGSGYSTPTYSTPTYSAPSPHNVGSSLVTDLAAVVPNVQAEVTHPVSGSTGALADVIVSLNDSHRWTRERIADWLETLDLDLRFPTSA